MLAIKLKRIGRRHQPAFRLVVTEKRSKLGGNYVEDLGWYNPTLKKSEFKKERVTHWLKIGAQPTDTVHNLLVGAGVITEPKIPVHKKPKKKEDEAGEVSASKTPKAESVSEGKSQEDVKPEEKPKEEKEPEQKPEDKKEESPPSTETKEEVKEKKE